MNYFELGLIAIMTVEAFLIGSFLANINSSLKEDRRGEE